MTMTRILIALSVFGLLAACGGSGDSPSVPKAQPAGESSSDIGDYIVHFSAQTTDQLPPEIASAYSIVRSPNRAMLNVSVLRESDNKSVEADIGVKAVNLTGQLKNITMRQIDEQEAVYYIGEVSVANQETLVFDLSVTPDGTSRAYDVRFKRQFYTD